MDEHRYRAGAALVVITAIASVTIGLAVATGAVTGTPTDAAIAACVDLGFASTIGIVLGRPRRNAASREYRAGEIVAAGIGAADVTLGTVLAGCVLVLGLPPALLAQPPLRMPATRTVSPTAGTRLRPTTALNRPPGRADLAVGSVGQPDATTMRCHYRASPFRPSHSGL